ncbi:MAG: glycosyltransferase [Anaerolineae bacterium]
MKLQEELNSANRQTILLLSTTDWDAPQFGSRQQIALQLARRGHRVLFVEIPRALHSLVSDPAGTRRALHRLGRARQVEDGLLVYTPLPVLPVYYNPLVNALNQRLLLRDLRRTLARLGWRPDVLWTYWPHTGYLVGKLGERAAVYHCIDDFVAVGYPLTTRSSLARMEAKQCRKVDLVFARTAALAAAKRELNPNTHLLPGGVDTAHFDPARVAAPPAEIAALPRPRVGLVGTIDDRVDVELLAHCAKELPSATFVLVGPVKRHRVDVGPLERLPNVHLLPPCHHAQVPAIAAALDTCLIPYRVNPYTEGLSPIKLYEYLALGKPVVATDLPYLRREAAHIRIARTADEFLASVREALAHPPTPEEQARWRVAAEAHSWERQVDEIELHLTTLLERE